MFQVRRHHRRRTLMARLPFYQSDITSLATCRPCQIVADDANRQCAVAEVMGRDDSASAEGPVPGSAPDRHNPRGITIQRSPMHRGRGCRCYRCICNGPLAWPESSLNYCKHHSCCHLLSQMRTGRDSEQDSKCADCCRRDVDVFRRGAVIESGRKPQRGSSARPSIECI